MTYIPKHTDFYGDYEFSTFITDPEDLDKYSEDLLELSDFAREKGHHDVSDILDIVSNSVNSGYYRMLHSYLGSFMKTVRDIEGASLN